MFEPPPPDAADARLEARVHAHLDSLAQVWSNRIIKELHADERDDERVQRGVYLAVCKMVAEEHDRNCAAHTVLTRHFTDA